MSMTMFIGIMRVFILHYPFCLGYYFFFRQKDIPLLIMSVLLLLFKRRYILNTQRIVDHL